MNLAVWALTPNGAELAARIASIMPNVHPYISRAQAPAVTARMQPSGHAADPQVFDRLGETLAKKFNAFDGHIFIMSTGIVVRMIAPLIRHKTIDPAVLVIDDRGRHVISLLSGHIGGANTLTHEIARLIDADPVITTATDVNDLPAIDVLAGEHDLRIENPEAIKIVNMAFLTGETVRIHDPHQWLLPHLPSSGHWHKNLLSDTVMPDHPSVGSDDAIWIFIDDVVRELPSRTLILRPPSLTAGIGCNRNTPREEMETLLKSVLRNHNLAFKSLKTLASVDIKNDEAGLLELAEDLGLPLEFYSRDTLKTVETIQTPSAMVEKHIGVKSVCEAAAILAAGGGRLIVPKQSTRNVTAAIARAEKSSTS